MIDQPARNRIIEDSRMKSLISGLGKTLGDALTEKKVLQKDGEGLSLKVKFEDSGNSQLSSYLDKIGQALVLIYNQFKGFKFTLPKIFKVQGSVDVDSISDLPPVHVENLKDLKPYFESVEKATKYLATAITIMSSKSTPTVQKAPIVNFDTKPLLDALQELKEASNKPTDNKQVVNMLRTVSEGISALVNKPSFSPPAVTNVNINALQGLAHSSQQTLNTGLNTIPSYGQLFNRRSILIYNNSSTVTIYIGGSDITSSSGLPVPPNSYSPVMDVGYNMIVYGLTASSTANIRVLELSNEATGR
jgi:hypothetical protein